MSEITSNNWYAMTDSAVMAKLGEFVAKLRLEANLSQSDLGQQAGVARSTISKMENGQDVQLTSLIAIMRSLQQLHLFDQFQFVERISPIALAEAERKKRKRASKS